MTNFNESGEQKRNWKEERRKMREDFRQKIRDGQYQRMGGMSTGGRVWTGIFILIIGVIALMKAALVPMPDWVFSWKMLLIAIGVYIGIRHGFRDMAWLVLIIIGGVFLVSDLYPYIEMRRYTWPVLLIILGIVFILRPRNRWGWACSKKKSPDSSGIAGSETIEGSGAPESKEDLVYATSIFGGTKKNILSKNFKGGEIVNIFGGTELNLSQANIPGEAVIDTTTLFGGTKLIVPSNWTVKSEAAVIFGGIDDKRAVTPVEDGNHKTLTLKGTVIFGGIDIKSY
ncbi:MAG: hypothetical protein JSS80_06020 [Bacteroidetes bacterium]|nr:hypothetical protein [Bacteroidota bacterium]